MYQVNGEKHVVFTRITFFWGKWKAFNYRRCECRCYSIAAITGRWANHQKCLRNFLFKFNSWTNHQQINGKVIAAILTIKSFTKQQQFSFFSLSLPLPLSTICSFSTRISIDHKYNVHDNQATWLQQNNVFRFFLGETDKKKLKITSLQWLQASERTEMFIGRCQNYRRKKSNNAKIIVCWCRANEAEAQPKPKPTPKPILLNIV